MKSNFLQALLSSSVLAVVATGLAADDVTTHAAKEERQGYSYATDGVLKEGIWKLILDESNLGGKELELAEVTIPAGTTVGSHTHKSVEIIYVLSGTFGHEVNGHLFLLKPGMVGVVRPGDHVRHIAPKEGDTKLLVIWTPGGERIFDSKKATTIKKLSAVKTPQ